MLWISDDDVERLLHPLALIEGIESGLAEFECGGISEGAPNGMKFGCEQRSYLTVYPSYSVRNQLVTTKVLVGARDNPTRGLPEIDAVVVVSDAETATILALIAARALTALRTAAATAVALKRLRHVPQPGLVALIGTGRQAHAHARVLAAAGLSSRFMIASPSGGRARAEAAARDMATATGLICESFEVGERLPETVMIVTATLSPTPVVGVDLPANFVLASVGPFYPHEFEIPTKLCRSAALVVSDHPDRLRHQWLDHPGVLPPDIASLSDLVAGRVTCPESGSRLFLSDGRAFEDNVAAALVLEAAIRSGSGVRLR